jgi:levansucrase
MVVESLFGEWRPLNGSGVVFSNPHRAPNQANAWLVLPDLSVASFVDQWNSSRRLESRFGGTFAPFLRLWLQGDTAGLAE